MGEFEEIPLQRATVERRGEQCEAAAYDRYAKQMDRERRRRTRVPVPIAMLGAHIMKVGLRDAVKNS